MDDLPPGGRGGGYREFWAALDANPGRWAIWPGATGSIAVTVRDKNRRSKNGAQYEGRQRDNVAYVRRLENS